ncbi:MAG: valine--tRNA ligase [Armatimonadota bacterium]|nr:valine--tRNA ligase [Armatimonadota bacterium]MDR7440311.1 valine--tRNA ligase [Armatimonadota bacterium]MDR7562770.1 valine--tRNA ligase [Armatimonadota bacterium]
MAIQELPKVYEPGSVETRLYAAWKAAGYFRAKPDPARSPWAVMMPLPNVTGELHIGHALNNTLQDILARFQRMRGRCVLYQPGTDHAGIATQNVVERELAKEGLRREDLGREEFEERVWAWVRKYGSIIYAQLERLGISCDWDRKVFTLDPPYYDAVLEAFVRLYRKGLIYRGKHMVNWCPRCRTAISDLEVEYEEVDSHLWYVRYRSAGDGPDVVVATQRPETIFADVAVAVHPDDERYRELVGKEVLVPLTNRPVPVIADRRVDPSLGTGAVKITPGHDPLDHEIGRDHGLPILVTLDEGGRMNELAPKFVGLDRFEARGRVARALEMQGLLVRTEPYRTRVGKCDRCHTVIEPYITDQWFLDVRDMARRTAEAIHTGRVRFHPERWTRVALDWLEGIRPWVISRQLWWGHRIPVWNCAGCGDRVASKVEPFACERCGGRTWQQDPDVLDTWFSSALWPLATLGWPQETEDLRYFYPTSVLVTDRGIIFLWVCRMIMFGLEFLDEVPFRDVYIHPTVHDIHGRRMSKSLGTGIDPMVVIEKYGADALRFALTSRCSAAQQDMRFDEKMIADVRTFANKIWNAARFVHRNLASEDPTQVDPASLRYGMPEIWILSRLERTIQAVTRAYETYEFDEAARSLYRFVWDEYCDWYLEMSKVDLAAEKDTARAARYVLWHVLLETMRLLHPIMPFLAEAVFRALPHQGDTLMLGPWPRSDPRRVHEEVERSMGLFQEAVREIRSLRADLGLGPHQGVHVQVFAPGAERELFTQLQPYLQSLARVERLELLPVDAPRPHPAAMGLAGSVELYIPLEAAQSRTLWNRVQRELEALVREQERLTRKLQNPEFRQKAPPEVVRAEEEKLWEARTREQKLRRYLEALQEV